MLDQEVYGFGTEPPSFTLPPLLTIGPRPALPSPPTHNQLGHLGAFSSLQYGALDLPRVHKTTYAPVIYTPLCIMFWRRGYTLLGEVGGGWALARCHFTGPKKLGNSRAQPPPTSPRNVYPRLQNIMQQ